MRNNNASSNIFTVRRQVTAHAPLALCLTLILLASPAWSVEDEVVRILAVSEAAPDVEVVLHWSEEAIFPTMARLVVRDVFAAEVSSAWIGASESGLVTEVLPAALVGIAPRGTQYSVHLEDEMGVPLGASYPYQVAIRCGEPQACHFVLRGGISTPDALLMDSVLANALEEVAADGAEKLFEAVLSNHPELLGEVYTLAWQLRILEDRFPIQQPCACRFTTYVLANNSACATCGAAHYLEVNLTDETEAGTQQCSGEVDVPPADVMLLDQFAVNGSSTLQVSAHCWAIDFGSTAQIEIQSGGWTGDEELPTAELGTCEQNCLGSLTYDVSYDANLTVYSSSSDQQVTENAFLELNGVYFMSVNPWEVKTSVSTSYDFDALVTQWTQSAPLGMGATLYSLGMIDLSHGSDGRGILQTGYSFHAAAQSSCTGPAAVNISAHGSASQEALRSAGGREVNILIGRCDG